MNKQLALRNRVQLSQTISPSLLPARNSKHKIDSCSICDNHPGRIGYREIVKIARRVVNRILGMFEQYHSSKETTGRNVSSISRCQRTIQQWRRQAGLSRCEVILYPNQVTSPRVMSRQLDNGAMVSSPLEDVEPFLDREDLAKNMSHIIGGSSLVNFDPHNRTCNNVLNQGLQEVSTSQSTDDKIVISRSSGIYEDIYRSGVCIWFTGLSGSGKTTTAIYLVDCFRKIGRRVTLLDGDVVRDNLSRGLGFSKQDRDVNILRIGYVASEIVRHGGICICAAISPYILTRREVRDLVGKDHFVEVFVDTPVEICEKRDTKGLYKKARLGELKGFTGIDDPYEPPLDPELKLDTTAITVEENCRQIMEHIMRRNLAGF